MFRLVWFLKIYSLLWRNTRPLSMMTTRKRYKKKRVNWNWYLIWCEMFITTPVRAVSRAYFRGRKTVSISCALAFELCDSGHEVIIKQIFIKSRSRAPNRRARAAVVVLGKILPNSVTLPFNRSFSVAVVCIAGLRVAPSRPRSWAKTKLFYCYWEYNLYEPSNI